jgi:hypothetical protein
MNDKFNLLTAKSRGDRLQAGLSHSRFKNSSILHIETGYGCPGQENICIYTLMAQGELYLSAESFPIFLA